MENDAEKILEKVRKLLALATSSNEHEAALAASRAQELLLKYNLDAAQLEKKEKPEPFTTKYDDDPTREEWKQQLSGIVARANLCRIVFIGNKIAWLGKPSNIEVAEYVTETLIRDLEKIAADKWAIILAIRAMLERNPEISLQAIADKLDMSWSDIHEIKTLHGKAWKNAFYQGAVSAIRERLKTSKEEFAASSANSNALIVRNDTELTAYTHSVFPGLRSRSYSGPSYNGAYGMGRNAGANMAFRNGVGAGGAAVPKRIGG